VEIVGYRLSDQGDPPGVIRRLVFIVQGAEHNLPGGHEIIQKAGEFRDVFQAVNDQFFQSGRFRFGELIFFQIKLQDIELHRGRAQPEQFHDLSGVGSHTVMDDTAD